MRVRLVAAIAVLVCAACVDLGWAGANLPPVPKSIPSPVSIKAVSVQSTLPPAPIPTEAPTTILKDQSAGEWVSKGSNEIRFKVMVEMPDKSESKTESKAEDAPLPPSPTKDACESQTTSGPAGLLRRSIYGIQRAMNNAECRRLWCENCRLNQESRRLAAEGDELAEKIGMVCPRVTTGEDCESVLRLTKEEAKYAAKVNKHAVERAKLKCEYAEHFEKKAKLEAKRGD